MRSRKAWVGLFTVAALLVLPAAAARSAAGAPAVTAAASVPQPEHDPFYAVPKNVAHYRDGQVIRWRPIQAYAWAVPIPGHAWELLYRTEDFRGRPTATVTTLMVPNTAWAKQGPRPIVSYQTAEDGVAPAGISRHAPIGLWGYSGGSFASVVAAEYQPRYAAELKLRAVALGGLVGSIRASINAFSGGPAGGAIPMGINGFLRAYPQLHLLRYLNSTGRRDVAATSHDCIDEAVSRYPFLSINDIEARPHALDAKPVARMLWRNSPLGIRGTPAAPIYDYHAENDELAPIRPALRLLHRFCDSGVVVQHVQSPAGEHLSEVVTGEPGAMRFFTDRFAGKRPIDTCKTMPWS